MVRKFVSFIFFILIVLGLTIVLPANVQSEQMNLFESTGISVKYPDSWIFQDQTQYLSGSPDNILKVSAVFYSSEDAESGSYNPAAVTFQVLDSSGNEQMTPTSMVESSLKLLESMMSDIELTQSVQDLNIGTNTYKMFELIGTGPEDNEIQSLSLCAKKGDWIISANYSAHPDNFEKYKDQAMKIIESIE